MAHLLVPTLCLGARSKDRLSELWHIAVRMIKIDDATPLQATPGAARIDHLLEAPVVIIA